MSLKSKATAEQTGETYPLPMRGELTGRIASLAAMEDDALQAILLEGVSRTFALTIPQLPPALARPVSNAYLLCRIVDTIEDEVSLDSRSKRGFCERFARVVDGRDNAVALAGELAPRLSDNTLPTEHELIRLMPRVVAITHRFEPAQREALATCVATMARGMAEFQDRDLRCGLATLDEMGHYCYYVAGVVGEMLTKLFCLYSGEIAAHRAQMLELSVSFGQGLQMTNILKDLWDDHARGVCWLPRDIFQATGFDLCDLHPGHDSEAFRAGFRRLIAVAHGHLSNALQYTLLIPAYETGVREFCLWALGMAMLTLRKINGHPGFSRTAEVKITRRAVKATIAISRFTRSHDSLLRGVFYLSGLGLPRGGEVTSARPPSIDSSRI